MQEVCGTSSVVDLEDASGSVGFSGGWVSVDLDEQALSGCGFGSGGGAYE